MRPLSYTQISTYQTCPLSYKLQYVDGLEPEAKWYFSFGDTLHKCAEYFFRQRLPGYPSLDELLDFYHHSWCSDGWPSPEDEAREKAYGEHILREFWRIHTRDFRVPLATERMFITDIQGVKLRGFIDRIDKLDSGRLAIVDYKSNQQLFTRDYVEGSLQLTLYQMACEQMWDMPVERLTLYHLRTNTPVSSGPRTREQLDEAARLVVTVAENIAAQRFPATENQYCPCDFPQYCPYYRHQYGEPVPDRSKPEPLRGVDIAAAVERYARLLSDRKDIDNQIEELRDLLVQYCQVEGLNRVYGPEHAVTFRMVERKAYDQDAVKAILEPLGLWHQVLQLDPKKLGDLLKSGDIPPDVQQALVAATEVVSTHAQLWVRDLKKDREE
ncbi:MAG: PD-(D/E)XK nuclease family protein [Chloroflexi bacterium]|nr:MAG: PD-(D/E)XK nuclease family protein [Chloroflexota bacterium]